MVRWTSSPSVAGVIDGLEIRRTHELAVTEHLTQSKVIGF
jgi:hypothetical protein